MKKRPLEISMFSDSTFRLLPKNADLFWNQWNLWILKWVWAYDLIDILSNSIIKVFNTFIFTSKTWRKGISTCMEKSDWMIVWTLDMRFVWNGPKCGWTTCVIYFEQKSVFSEKNWFSWFSAVSSCKKLFSSLKTLFFAFFCSQNLIFTPILS